jgi:hypothetical protein
MNLPVPVPDTKRYYFTVYETPTKWLSFGLTGKKDRARMVSYLKKQNAWYIIAEVNDAEESMGLG